MQCSIEGLAWRRSSAILRQLERAKGLPAHAPGEAPTAMQRLLGVSRPTIHKCIEQALAAGVGTGLRDRFHRPHAPQISKEAKAWVTDPACRKPKSLGRLLPDAHPRGFRLGSGRFTSARS